MKKMYDLVKKMLNGRNSGPYRDYMACSDGDEMYVTDGYRVLYTVDAETIRATRTEFPDMERPNRANTYRRMSSLFENRVLTNYISVKELKEGIKYTRKVFSDENGRRAKRVLYKIPDTEIVVNAAYLLDFIEVAKFPQFDLIEISTLDGEKGRISPIKVRGNNSLYYLMPVDGAQGNEFNVASMLAK